jgi:hypothetical protein
MYQLWQYEAAAGRRRVGNTIGSILSNILVVAGRITIRYITTCFATCLVSTYISIYQYIYTTLFHMFNVCTWYITCGNIAESDETYLYLFKHTSSLNKVIICNITAYNIYIQCTGIIRTGMINNELELHPI